MERAKFYSPQWSRWTKKVRKFAVFAGISAWLWYRKAGLYANVCQAYANLCRSRQNAPKITHLQIFYRRIRVIWCGGFCVYNWFCVLKNRLCFQCGSRGFFMSKNFLKNLKSFLSVFEVEGCSWLVRGKVDGLPKNWITVIRYVTCTEGNLKPLSTVRHDSGNGGAIKLIR